MISPQFYKEQNGGMLRIHNTKMRLYKFRTSRLTSFRRYYPAFPVTKVESLHSTHWTPDVYQAVCQVLEAQNHHIGNPHGNKFLKFCYSMMRWELLKNRGAEFFLVTRVMLRLKVARDSKHWHQKVLSNMWSSAIPEDVFTSFTLISPFYMSR